MHLVAVLRIYGLELSEVMERVLQMKKSLLQLQLCTAHNLIITNTLYRQCNRLKGTWMHPRSKKWYIIDYVITRQTQQGWCIGREHSLGPIAGPIIEWYGLYMPMIRKFIRTSPK